MLRLAAGSRLRRRGRLFSSHAAAWRAAWARGRIDVRGADTRVGRASAASLYSILSALPPHPYTPHPNQSSYPHPKQSPFIGLSPSGLAYGDNNVRIF